MTTTIEPDPDAPVARTGRRTRVTLSGARRRADVALPSDEPLGLLVPDLVALVGGRPGADPGGYRLTGADGRALDLDASLRECGVPDGALVRLDPVIDALPAPILHDVADHVADDVEDLPGRWDGPARRWTATAVVVAATLVATLLACSALGPVVPLVVAVLLVVAGAVVALSGRWPAGSAVLLAGVAAVLVTVAWTTSSWPLRGMRWALVVALAVALVTAIGGHRRAGLLGSGALLLQLALWWGFGLAGLSAAEAGAVLAVVAIGLLGLLPRLAVVLSGLAALDDRQAGDEPVPRAAATAAVDSAHLGLALACAATAVSGGLAGWALATTGSGWAAVLAGVTAVALLLRQRAFPLTVEVVALVTAALAIGTGLLRRALLAAPDLWWLGAAATLAVAGSALVLLVHRPPPDVRARGRQLADRVEGVAVVLAVPLAVGVFGGYERLLDLF